MLTDRVSDHKERLHAGDTFRFSCSPGMACFNACCRNKDLVLTPYDVVRLKTACGLHSDRFLERYVLYRQDPGSGFPVLSLRMQDDPGKRCPFVAGGGCTVYRHRPTACRLYPLGRATAPALDAGGADTFFFLLDTPGCLGVGEQHAVRLQDWLEGQGLLPYLEFNNLMLKLLFHKKRDRRVPLSPGQVQKVILACYNPDAFRTFLFRSGFLKQAGVPAGRRRKLRENDEALLRFGFEFLEKVLFA